MRFKKLDWNKEAENCYCAEAFGIKFCMGFFIQNNAFQIVMLKNAIAENHVVYNATGVGWHSAKQYCQDYLESELNRWVIE
jgi:hypothetical protein